MRKFIFYIVLAFAIAIVTAGAFYYLAIQNLNLPKAFMINNKTYTITAYAITPAQREKGLMNVTVTNTTFMLFYFDQPSVYPFWMKDTYTQLDMMWVNASAGTGIGTVVYAINATPCINYSKNQTGCIVYVPTSNANYVIETKAGFIEQNNVHIGTQIKFIK